jgi:hypothetical protein
VGLLLLFALGASCAEVPGGIDTLLPQTLQRASQQVHYGKRAKIFENLPSDIHGLTPEQLHRINPAHAVTAYQDCKRHGAACKIPCESISSCAACHPSDDDGKTAVCAFCMPGYTLSANQSSCVACKSNTFSAGGSAASCTLCPEGETAGAAAAQCTSPKGAPKRKDV